MSESAPSTARASLSRPGSGPQAIELLRSHGYMDSRLGAWPPEGVEAPEEIESVWAGLGGAHSELREAWVDVLNLKEATDHNPLLSAEGKRAELTKLLNARLEKVEAVLVDRGRALGLARGRLEQARARAVERAYGEDSPRRQGYEQELRQHLRSLSADERRSFIRRAVQEGDAFVCSAVFRAPRALVDLQPAELREHLEAEWEGRAAACELEALAALAKGEEVVRRAHSAFKRMVTKSVLPPSPPGPPPRPAA